MKQTTRLFAVLCMTLVIVLLMASCDDLLSDFPFGNETTPAETTPAETTPNVTTPEATTPEVTTPEVTTPEVTTPDGTQPSEPPHDHEFVDGKCECGFIPVFENASVYDNDGDGANDVYLFTPIIPEKFTGEDVVHVWCMDYIPELSTSYVSDKNMFSTIYTMYCEKEFDEYFTYKVTVPEAGVYEMAIHTRLKDTRARGAKFIINKDTANEYAFELSYQFATEEELNAARENDYTSTSYMYSIRVELQAGDNYIRVEGPTQDLRVFYFRDFYFVKVADLCTEHTWGETITQNPTRCEDGFVTRICARCGHSAISVIKATHDFGPSYVTVYSTCCLEVGETQRKCKQCGYVKTGTYRENHSLVLTEYITVPTCTEKGQAIYSCIYCGEGTKTINLSPFSNHVVENGFCIYCENVSVPIFEQESGYDNDGDGKNDIFYFSPSPEKRFVENGVICMNALYYQPRLSCEYVPRSIFSSGNNHVFFEQGQEQYAVYKITVPEAGVYEMAIHLRLKDTSERGGKYTVNEGTAYEYSFETSYQFETEEEVYAARENDYTMTTYMYGIYLNLQEGDNYIKIELSSGGEKSMQWREFFFVKVVDPCTEHTWGEWVTVTEPNCEEDGLQKRTCTKCYATEEAPIDDLAGFHVWRNPATIKTQITPCLQEWFDQCVCSNCGAVKSTNTRLFSTHKWGLTTVVKAPTCQEDGLTQKVCNICGYVSETVTKTTDHQWSTTVVKVPTCQEDGLEQKVCNICGYVLETVTKTTAHQWSSWYIANDIPCGEEGSQSERVCQTCGIKETHDNPKACYVWINHTTLELGTCIQPGKVSEECQYCGKVQIRELQMAGHKWSEYVEVKPASCTAHGKETRTCTVCGATSTEQIYKLDHKYENGICVSCGRAENAQEPIPVVEKNSNYDNDGDGANDVYFFTTVLPEKFKGEDTIHLWMDEYEADLSSNYVPESMFSGNYNHVYFDEGQGQYAVYKITVSQAGVYEMAIHTRLKDTKERGGKYTINAGTEHEYSFETSFQFATDEEVYAARENEYTMSSYMYGMYLELQEGDNYIKIELSSGGEKSMHWREFFFVKVEE